MSLMPVFNRAGQERNTLLKPVKIGYRGIVVVAIKR